MCYPPIHIKVSKSVLNLLMKSESFMLGKFHSVLICMPNPYTLFKPLECFSFFLEELARSWLFALRNPFSFSILAYISVGSIGKSLYLSNSEESDITSPPRAVAGVSVDGEEGGPPSSRPLGHPAMML